MTIKACVTPANKLLLATLAEFLRSSVHACMAFDLQATINHTEFNFLDERVTLDLSYLLNY